MTKKVLIIIGVLMTASLAFLVSQHKTTLAQTHSMHDSHSDGTVSLLEGGQDTFAALIEVVALLEQTDDTDWTSVTITALHAHLLDMNHLMTDTTVTDVQITGNTILFDIRGTTSSIPAIHRMVPAHSQFIQQSRGWSISTTANEYGATLTITVDNTQTLTKLKALGFYGFMALDAHHQAHHLQMALGGSH